MILLDQNRSVDKARLGRHVGMLPPDILAAVDLALRRSLAL